jgi:hypothetical protein
MKSSIALVACHVNLERNIQKKRISPQKASADIEQTAVNQS